MQTTKNKINGFTKMRKRINRIFSSILKFKAHNPYFPTAKIKNKNNTKNFFFPLSLEKPKMSLVFFWGQEVEEEEEEGEIKIFNKIRISLCLPKFLPPFAFYPQLKEKVKSFRLV